VNIHSF